MSVRLDQMKTYGVALGPIERQIIADVEEATIVSSMALARYQWLGDFLKRFAEWKRTNNG